MTDSRLIKINTAVNVKIKRTNIKMRIDTCSDVNIIDEYSFNKIKNSVKLKNIYIIFIWLQLEYSDKTNWQVYRNHRNEEELISNRFLCS